MEIPPRDGRSDGGAKRSSASAMGPAWLMTGSVALGVIAGFFLDRRFAEGRHMFLLGGSLLGLIAGFTSLVYATQRLGK